MLTKKLEIINKEMQGEIFQKIPKENLIFLLDHLHCSLWGDHQPAIVFKFKQVGALVKGWGYSSCDGTAHLTGQLFLNFSDNKPWNVEKGHCPQDHQSGWAGNCGHIWLQKCLQRGTGALPRPLKQSACLQLIGTQFHLVLPRCLTHLVRHHNGPSDGGKCLGTALQLDCYSSLLKKNKKHLHTWITEMFNEDNQGHKSNIFWG